MPCRTARKPDNPSPLSPSLSLPSLRISVVRPRLPTNLVSSHHPVSAPSPAKAICFPPEPRHGPRRHLGDEARGPRVPSHALRTREIPTARAAHGPTAPLGTSDPSTRRCADPFPRPPPSLGRLSPTLRHLHPAKPALPALAGAALPLFPPKSPHYPPAPGSSTLLPPTGSPT